MKAIETDIAYVQTCTCPCTTFHTYWELLCNQLFVQTAPEISEEETFDEVRVWHDADIAMTVTTSPYTFTITIEVGETAPQASDVLLYAGKYYIVGAVASGTAANTYVCSNCLAVDLSIIGVYAALLEMNTSITTAEGGRVTAESGRVSAENGRVLAENGRVIAENGRNASYTNAEAARDTAYGIAEDARDTAFESAEASRVAYLNALVAPWIVEGTLVDDEGTFVSDDEEDTPAEAKTRFYAGQRTYLKLSNGKAEDIIADDGAALVTISGWKWNY